MSSTCARLGDTESPKLAALICRPTASVLPGLNEWGEHTLGAIKSW